MVIENKKYNRLETENDHVYLNQYGFRGFGDKTIYGYIKCKLVHAKNLSVIIPDQVYFKCHNTYKWIQPFNFMPCLLLQTDNSIQCQLYFDISCGYSIYAEFTSDDYIRNYPDGSQLFECNLLVPEDIADHAIGIAERDKDDRFSIELFHHTKPETEQKILASSKLLGSKWNIQGNVELTQFEHVYFTPINVLKHNRDLEQIAMSEIAEIALIRDNFELPAILPPNWKKLYENDCLFMEVYRENLTNRTSTLNFMVPSEYVASHHIIKHSPINASVYYEIATPFIHRIPIKKGDCIVFDKHKISRDQSVLHYRTVIIGDATSLDGLQAPYDEENTQHIFQIQFVSNGISMLDFWFENANQNLFSGRNCTVINPKE